MQTIGEKFVYDLGEIYDAETRFLEAQGRLATQAAHPALRALLEAHIQESTAQLRALDQVYSLLEMLPAPTESSGAAALIAEGDQQIVSAASEQLRDCAIADTAVKGEHFEIAAYRSLIAIADLTGNDPLIALLASNLDQEEAMATRLETLAPDLLQLAVAGQRAAQVGE